jgi:prolyl oligopeptidase
MCLTLAPPPHSDQELVTDTLHGVAVTDPYRWLEDSNSLRTHAWIEDQTRYARAHLDGIPGRTLINERVREFLETETFDSLQKVGTRYFFRKRLAHQEQPCTYMREGAIGEDQLLLDPSTRGTGPHTAIKPLIVSPDGRLLLYEIKEGGERTGTFELLDIENRRRLDDFLPRGYLRGFAFSRDGKGFYYVHERLGTNRPYYRAAYEHRLGASFSVDREVFSAGEDRKIWLTLLSGNNCLLFLKHTFFDRPLMDVYLQRLDAEVRPLPILLGIEYFLSLHLLGNRILAVTDRGAPNRRVMEIPVERAGEQGWTEIIPESDSFISDWFVAGERIFVSYGTGSTQRVLIFESHGGKTGEIAFEEEATVRLTGTSSTGDEVFFETESFTQPVETYRYSVTNNERSLWAKRTVPFDPDSYICRQVSYPSKDGTRIPMFLTGRRDAFEGGPRPTIMTSYGGYGVSMTPRYSVFVSLLMERGCLFALPSIRGGSEFGLEWHNAAKRRNRQTAYDDFLTAAEWLIETGRTSPAKLAIFGGSNSGLLVGSALTQRPTLFRAVVCIAPMLDMLRYHLFDDAYIWIEEFGSADNADDFQVLLNYSPYQQVRDGTAYPATLIVAGDIDRNCNPLHGRKMTAKLQAANSSNNPILLDYGMRRGHSPVLPLSERIRGLTDRLAFVCKQLEL